jgi:uridylate kinase
LIKVIDLGGSLLVPGDIDVEYLAGLVRVIKDYLDRDDDRRLIVVCGGGEPARKYQEAYRQLVAHADPEAQDWIGIAATRLNAELFKRSLGNLAPDPIVTDPTAVLEFRGRVLVGSGWKPGFSTDYDAVLLAERFGAPELVRLSNVAKVYTGDPNRDSAARPVERATWSEFSALVAGEWTPGRRGPMDPVATRRAAKTGLRVIFAGGSDLENLSAILADGDYEATVIGPD